jgi:hypothetical protein
VSTPLERVAAIADAVLYEGYLLYPYRASAAKNRARWQFGVLVPPGYVEAGTGEHASACTECLFEPGVDAELLVRVRFLQEQARTVQRVEPDGRFRSVDALAVAGTEVVTWDEAVERHVDVSFGLGELLDAERIVPIAIPGGQEIEELRELSGVLAGRVVRRRHPLHGELRLSARPVPADRSLVRIRAEVANTSPWRDPDARREDALRYSLIAAHTVLVGRGGGFLSLLEPPVWAAGAAAGCVNQHTWPVLAGPPGSRDVLLSSPIVLYDHPVVAPESPGDLFDATEIDELLVLRTLTLTEEEKRQMRATDSLARDILDRVENMSPETMRGLHGRLRTPRAGTEPAAPPWWDPAADASVRPERESVLVSGVRVARGSRVRLRPARCGADAQDMFLAGRAATVHAVFLDVDGERHLAVTVDDDPAAEVQDANGRYRYFSPDEVEPLSPDAEVAP